MKVTQAVFGVFHHFELARELERRGYLEKIYSTWPWARLKREGLPRRKVETFPWIHTPEIVLGRAGLMPEWLSDEMGLLNAKLFDNWTLQRISPCDAFIALAGAGLKTGQYVQKAGGKFICDRGSTHPRFQDAIVRQEYALWNVKLSPNDIRDTLREEEIYAVSDAVTVPSEFARRTFLDQGLPKEKVHVIPYGVRLENFTPGDEIKTGRFEVLFAGSVSLRKGVPYLLEAFAKLKHPAKRLRIAGAIQTSMKSVMAKMPLENVEFLGSLPPARLAQIMSESHVLVLPSVEDGFGLVMAQAMACGCPVISSTNTGCADLFTDGVEGFIVPIRDSEKIAARMQELADLPYRQQAIAEAALQRVRSLGGWTDYGDRWESLLRELTGAA